MGDVRRAFTDKARLETMTLLREIVRADRVEQERYLTITIERKLEETFGATLEATIHKIPLSIMQKKASAEHRATQCQM